MRYFIIILCLFFIPLGIANAQGMSDDELIEVPSIIIGNDTIPHITLRQINIFPAYYFGSREERMQYTRLVRDVRVAYPYARMIAESIIETYEQMETLPDDKAKQKHMEEVKKYMMNTYKPHLRKMSKNQGKILMKLIDRECNTSSYNIVKAIVGAFQAGVYNVFAGVFGNSLKVKYDPDGKDREIESIVLQIEEGSLNYYYSLGTILR